MKCLLAICLLAAAGLPAAAQQSPSDADVQTRIDRLVQRLFELQRGDGSWQYQEYPVGATALALFALRQANVPARDARLQRAAAYLAAHTDGKVYSEGLVPCALELMDPAAYRPRIQGSVQYLQRAQGQAGGWAYSADDRRSPDHSNSQFAVLGLAAAERHGVAIAPATRQMAVQYFVNAQNPTGTWAYRSANQHEFSMTCAAVASLSLLGLPLEQRRHCCTDYEYDTRMARGLNALADMMRDLPRQDPYALYALERVGMVLDLKQIGGRDWYREGVASLLRHDPARLELPNAAFILLFLAKGSAPVAIAKWKYNGNWNFHHHDVQNWVAFAGHDLQTRLDWLPSELKGLDSPAAKASLLYVNGVGEFRPTPEELNFLRAFLEANGTVVLEAVCDDERFLASASQVFTQELFPSLNARFEPLDPDHPLCRSHHRLRPEVFAARQLRCTCRDLRVVILQRNIACALDGALDARDDLPRARTVATNLLAWALASKKADKKLDTAKLDQIALATESLTPDQLQRTAAAKSLDYAQPFGRLRHRGEWLVSPRFFATLQQSLQRYPELPLFDGELYVDPQGGDLHQCAVLFLAGNRDPALTEAERLNLRQYLQSGGFLLATAACSSKEFDAGFRHLVQQVLPNDKLEEIPPDAPLWRSPYNLAASELKATPAFRTRFGNGWAPLLGVRREGRWLLVYSPADLCTDLSEGLHDSIPGYRAPSALRLAANALAYAFQP